MGRSTVHYTDNKTNTILKALHNKLRPAGTPVQRVEYIIELLLLRIFEVKLKREDEFKQLRKLFTHEAGKDNDKKLFYYLRTVGSEKILAELNQNIFPFYSKILNHARTVIKGNLSTKIQDQLVLIQEVFENSNFTNNVQSGNLEEIINLVAEIDEERLLKTDLLGDAIESALSETGGTKDIGLFRTPDHVRQFMVGLLEPKITDNLFDPACGTGGFLFDSYGFVTESISQDDIWPGPKAHPEMQEWFKKYFKKNPAPMPTVEQTNQFYRSGIYGIEYLGMIRKMAAVNFYIRGLNPHNIEQGDSLAKFNKELQFKNMFSIVLANPPFGAERDQKAYPNVWEEYAKESETTILFVKLMLDALKPGGRCAVVVSEGFLTWDQTSAKTLRHMLLTDANLIAIFGLPQGVFVSKGGQGPKTSILLFEKGPRTKNVWFYNVENDGYTKGANRTPIEGCQLIKALDMFHQYVKHGKTVPETQNSFTLSVDWLTVVDPRIKEKIRAEVAADIEQKKQSAREILLEKLNKKQNPVGCEKFTKKEYDAKIYQFECVWQQKLQNEIAKHIDKAHAYSLNSSTYRSNLTEKQLIEWDAAVLHHKHEKNGHSLDKRYAMLQQSTHDNAVKQIAAFDPKNAIEADIVREYLTAVAPDQLKKYPSLKALDHIFKSGAKYPIVKLAGYLILNENKIKPCEQPNTKFVVLGVSNETGIFINKDLNPQDTKQTYYLVKKNQFCYNPYRINVGSIGLNRYDYDNQIISGAYTIFGTEESRLSSEYLLALFENQRFLEYVNLKANGGVRMNFTFGDMGNWEIPLPPIDKQQEIVEEIKKRHVFIASVESILNNWEINIEEGIETFSIGIFAKVFGGTAISSEDMYSKNNKERIPLIKIGSILNGEIIEDQVSYVSREFQKTKKDYILQEGDVVFAMTRPIINSGFKYAVVNKEYSGSILNQRVGRYVVNQRKALSKYLAYMMRSKKFIDQLKAFCKDEANQPNVSNEEFESIKIPLPSIEMQHEIVERVEKEEGVLKELKAMADTNKRQLQDIIKRLWED